MVCFSKSFSHTSLAHPDFKVLDLNTHVKHMGFSLKVEKWRIFNKRLLLTFSQLLSGSFIKEKRCDGKSLIQELLI